MGFIFSGGLILKPPCVFVVMKKHRTTPTVWLVHVLLLFVVYGAEEEDKKDHFIQSMLRLEDEMTYSSIDVYKNKKGVFDHPFVLSH